MYFTSKWVCVVMYVYHKVKNIVKNILCGLLKENASKIRGNIILKLMRKRTRM